MSSPTTAPVGPLPDSDVYDELRARVDGPLARPGDPLFATLVSPWNLAVDIRPDAVLAARTANDVVEAVRFAGRNGLTVTPQATGHGPIASLVGHLLVTTGGLDECTVHPEGWARVGAGVKWLKGIRAAAPHGLAPLSGSISDVGVAGYTTGGGLGPMARTYGLASDRVRAFEVVTGDGELRRATPPEHPELYFGLRGGKGALGIVTAIEFDLVHRPTFHGGALWFDGADAARVMAAWQDWAEPLPEAPAAATTSSTPSSPLLKGWAPGRWSPPPNTRTQPGTFRVVKLVSAAVLATRRSDRRFWRARRVRRTTFPRPRTAQ